MDWNNPYAIALYQTLLIPVLIFGVGLLVEWIANAITGVLARLVGEKAAFLIRNRLTFVGTIHHELAHALLALISGAKVTKIELFHVRGRQLGCVEFVPRGTKFSKAVQLTLASIAPVICGAVSLCLLSWLFRYRCQENWQYIVTGYLFVSIAFHMNMSSQDVKNALHGMPVTMVICYIAFWITGVRFLG